MSIDKKDVEYIKENLDSYIKQQHYQGMIPYVNCLTSTILGKTQNIRSPIETNAILYKYGYLEKNEKGKSKWRLSAKGYTFGFYPIKIKSKILKSNDILVWERQEDNFCWYTTMIPEFEKLVEEEGKEKEDGKQ